MTQKAVTTASRIPEFSSREEEASFWDTHDFTDYLDELKPVRVRAHKSLTEGLTIRLDPDTLARLRERALVKGVATTALARAWILQQLAESP